MPGTEVTTPESNLKDDTEENPTASSVVPYEPTLEINSLDMNYIDESTEHLMSSLKVQVSEPMRGGDAAVRTAGEIRNLMRLKLDTYKFLKECHDSLETVE